MSLNKDFVEGAMAAAGVAAQYNATSNHPYRIDDCILSKLNIRRRKPRKNPKALPPPPAQVDDGDYMSEDDPKYPELVARITRAVREADEGFQKSGGSSRHWVRECFLPMLAKHGLKIEEAVRA